MKEFNQSNIKLFEKDVSKWEDEKKRIEQENQLINMKYNSELEKWENRKKIYEREKTENNNKIDKLYEDCKSGNVDAVEQFFMSVLETIELPFYYSKSVEIEYDPSAKIIIVDYLLPVIEDIPNLKNVSYSKSKKEFKETNHTESYMKKKYESVVYQIVMQTLNYIFSISEDFDIIDTIAFNGKINTIDKTKGKIIEPCVLSVVVCRNDFDEIFLEGVDPKAWFKSAKGVSATSLANVTPVAPILTMSRDDKRFVDGYAVSEMLDESVNLATIDWQDFENLIREIFEKEFNVNGGEVKITQASRDGGVDAVAFDPDPVRGGKIVIQAKRYNNVVGVSAVRDLYGTVLNEGAMKGILVTTSNYGNDAYNFAQGKPLTLLNGGNLLHLLEKHGHKAKIDLRKGKGPTIE